MWEMTDEEGLQRRGKGGDEGQEVLEESVDAVVDCAAG